MGNMDTAGLLRLVLVVLALTMNQVLARSDINVAVGDDLVLELDPQPAQVQRVVWKHGANLLAEMSLGEFDYYGPFNGHTVLEPSGRLTVSDIQLTEGGDYSVEVNNVIQAKRYSVRVFKKLGRPTIWVTTLVCGPGSESCTLVCDVDGEQPQDVSYEWQLAGEETRIPGKKLIINQTTQATNFTCWAKNPVSQQASESQKNPLIDASKPPDTLNVAVGGDLVLELDLQPTQDKQVLWKHGANLLAEMTLGEFLYYGSFRGHTVLEPSGRLTVSDIQLTEGGDYSVEVNNVIQAKRYSVRVFKKLGRPTIWVTTLVCGPGSESCTLVCDVDGEQSQDVSYEWQLAGEETRIPGKKLIINQTTQATNFTCWAKNPVSQQASESQKNPLIDVSKPPDTLNVAVGGDLVLELDLQPTQVKQVLWKHGAKMLAEMTQGEFLYYGSFRGHTVLEDSGRLTVSNIKVTEGGDYSVVVNNVIQAKRYNVRVFEKLGQPTIRITTQICGPGSESCTLVCDVDGEPSQDVSYEWQLAGEESRIPGKELIIDQTTKASNFTCWAKNPVSEEASESQKNPIFSSPTPTVENHTLGISIGGVFIGIRLICVAVLVYV